VRYWLFQSSPARGGGCNQRDAVERSAGELVSILTRPWGRVQRRAGFWLWCIAGRFNPHPPVGAGAT